MANVNSKITLKLLIDARSNKVLFGEGGKDFVDFILSILTLPLGSVIKLLSASTMNGSIGKLYQSVENLNEMYLVANRDKSSLLQPKVSTYYVKNHLLLDTKATFVVPSSKYYCNNCDSGVTAEKNNICPNCNNFMDTQSIYMFPSSFTSSATKSKNKDENAEGFVKGVITYMITDDLEVTPMSAISSITLINCFIMKKDVQLEEKVVAVGMEEGLALLKASLDSPTVLTDVFCSPKKNAEPPSSSIMDDVDN